jgi:mannitol-1-/sugar-/sorbitol-6-phosphatase
MNLATQGALFDFDGVLVDSTPAVLRHWDAFAVRHGLGPENPILCAHGRRAVEKIRAFRNENDLAFDVDEEMSWFEQLEVDEAADLTVFPGAMELLSAVRRGRWAIYTACTARLVAARLHAAGLPIPEVVISADDVAHGKPDPEGYLLAAEQLGVSASNCVVVEDAPSGVLAGRNAGATVIAVATTHRPQELTAADIVALNLADVRAAYEGHQLTFTVKPVPMDTQMVIS